MSQKKYDRSRRDHWVVNPKFVEFHAYLLKCNVVVRIQFAVEEVRAENDLPCHAVFISERAVAIRSGEVGVLQGPGMLEAPTLGFLTARSRAPLVLALAPYAEVSTRVDFYHAYVVNVLVTLWITP